MFCRSCGKELQEKAVSCIGCGMRPDDGDAYCPACGFGTKEKQVICTACGASLQGHGAIEISKIFDNLNKKIEVVATKESAFKLQRADLFLVLQIVLYFVLGVMIYVWLFSYSEYNPVSFLGIILVSTVLALYVYRRKLIATDHEVAELVETKEFLVLAGSVMFFVGIFAPISTWSKTWSYFGLFLVGRGDAIIIVLLAIALLVFAYRKLYMQIYLLGVICLVCLLYTFNQELSDARLITDGYDVLKKAYDVLGEKPDMPPSPELRFGWLFLFGGLGLIAVSSVYKKSKT